MSDHDTDHLPDGVDELAAEANAEAEAPKSAAELALEEADAELAAAIAKREAARAAAVRDAARPKDRETAEKLVELAQQQLADKEKFGQDVAHAKHDLATTRSTLAARPVGLTDEDWEFLQERLNKRLPDQEQAVETALAAHVQANVTPAEIDLAAHVLQEARDYLTEFDAEPAPAT